MKRAPSAIGCAILGAALAATTGAHADADPSRWVDPFIGTGAHGHTFPGPVLPFGMAQPGPDTRLEGWDGCSGYHASDRVIHGFSHTHLSGTGIADYTDVLLMPLTGAVRFANGLGREPGAGYSSRFDKSTERAAPGYYAVELADHGVAVELTATDRTGFHRYRFPAGRDAAVIVDLAHRDPVLESSIRVVGDREIEGLRRSSSWARDQIVHFVARFSRPFAGVTLARDGVEVRGARVIDGSSVQAALGFGDAGGELLVGVGLSAVDVAGARRNLDAELPAWDFDAVRRAARERWNAALGAIEIEGGSDARRTVFYTALYHSLLAPHVFSDVDGRYRGMDGNVHRAEGRRQYTVFSLWDTFRATHPLFTLIDPARVRELAGTMLAQYREGGRLPVWELAANETDTMIGYHAVPVLADAWLKGIRGFDGALALEAMIASASGAERGLGAYRRQGFIGASDDGESVSKTLEYAFDDACIARMATALGRDDVAREYGRRSQAWRHLLDPATGLFRARRDQRWIEPFDPRRVDQNYTEANAWQYAFFAPHDLASLIEATGGDERFVERLDALFSAPVATTGREQVDITGLIGQYAHGNEPSHHVAWLYHYAGRPDRSAERVREITNGLYAARPDGLSGNDDCGQMSSWLVFAALGLYPVDPCSDEYVVVPPEFERVTLHLEGGRTFTILAPGASGGGVVRAAALDGQPLARSFLRHAEIARGGTLALELAARPGSSWGTAPADRPRSKVAAERVLAAPFVRAGAERFRGETTVELGTSEPGAVLRHTLDPARPESEWETYRAPFVLRDTARVRFRAEREGRTSPVVEASFRRIPTDWSVALSTLPNQEYTAGGPDALIDGVRGSAEWRTGGWQGYQETDFEATVDLGRSRTVRRAGAGFLQDVRSWIWMPVEVSISASVDGASFQEVARVAPGVPQEERAVVLRDVVADLVGVEARWLRIHARTLGTIPDWHPGRGERAFLFVDELVVE